MMYIGSKLISPTFGSTRAIQEISNLSKELDEVIGENITNEVNNDEQQNNETDNVEK